LGQIDGRKHDSRKPVTLCLLSDEGVESCLVQLLSTLLQRALSSLWR
jgi:hypothetical protein